MRLTQLPCAVFYCSDTGVGGSNLYRGIHVSLHFHVWVVPSSCQRSLNQIFIKGIPKSGRLEALDLIGLACHIRRKWRAFVF
jgi:hypothetical protein